MRKSISGILQSLHVVLGPVSGGRGRLRGDPGGRHVVDSSLQPHHLGGGGAHHDLWSLQLDVVLGHLAVTIKLRAESDGGVGGASLCLDVRAGERPVLGGSSGLLPVLETQQILGHGVDRVLRPGDERLSVENGSHAEVAH